MLLNILISRINDPSKFLHCNFSYRTRITYILCGSNLWMTQDWVALRSQPYWVEVTWSLFSDFFLFFCFLRSFLAFWVPNEIFFGSGWGLRSFLGFTNVNWYVTFIFENFDFLIFAKLSPKPQPHLGGCAGLIFKMSGRPAGRQAPGIVLFYLKIITDCNK